MRRGQARAIAALVAGLILGLASIVQSGAASAATEDEETCYIIASYRLFWRMDASFEAYAHWRDLFDLGHPYTELPEFLASQEPWLGVAVDDLYGQALDRGPDAAGRQYWMDQLQAGALVNTLGSQIYGSDEFYRRAGSTPAGFVTQLYGRILRRAPQPQEVSYWVAKLGGSPRGALASSFFASSESREDRISALYEALLGRGPDPSGLAFWKHRLLTQNDVRVAVMLASSPEFFARTMLPDETCLDLR